MQAPMSFDHFDARLDPATLASVDEWRARQCDTPSRSDAIRRLIEASLDSPRPVQLSDGERLIARMVGDLIRGLKVVTAVEPDFVDAVVAGGHFWALSWEHPDLFHRREDASYAVREVADTLEMWASLEEGLERLPIAQRQRIVAKAALPQEWVQYRGFDAHQERDHLNIAGFLIGSMGHFPRFSDRAWQESQTPTLRTYRRMLGRFHPIRSKLNGRSLTNREIECVLGAL